MNSISKLRTRGFTLVELLVVVLILGILFAISASAMANLEANSRVERTKTIIARLDQLIMEKYEGYKTRAIPLRIPPGVTAEDAARIRLYAIRELMRMELPDRPTDLADGPQNIPVSVPGGPLKVPMPAAWKAMNRKMPSGWTSATAQSHAGAECLYAIVSTIRVGDARAIDFLSAREIGDADGDGALEIWDAWGNPIQFLRWAPGFTQENNALTMQTKDSKVAPDPFDPLKVDPRLRDSDTTNDTFALKPLIFSGGRDRKFDIDIRGNVSYATGGMYAPSDPFFLDSSDPVYVGTPKDSDGDGYSSYADNITNHYFEVR